MVMNTWCLQKNYHVFSWNDSSMLYHCKRNFDATKGCIQELQVVVTEITIEKCDIHSVSGAVKNDFGI